MASTEPEIEDEKAEARATRSTLFPSGTRALVGTNGAPLDDKASVTLINVSLARVTVRVPDLAFKSTKGHPEKEVTILPFGKIEVNALYARRILSCQEVRGAQPHMVVAPASGDCKGATFQGFGKTFSTCPYGNCKTHGPLPEGISWSVWQAQHRISMLMTEPAIRRLIENIDSRSETVAWGLEVISQRNRARNERLGLTPGSSEAIL